MLERIERRGPLAQALAKYCMIPVERIEDFCILVQHDQGVVMLHTLCCNEHARQGLAVIAATPPDTPDLGDYRSEN